MAGGGSAARFEAAPFPFVSVGPPVGAAYLAAPHVPARQLVGQQGGGKEEEGFQGGSVRAWYMVVRAKRCQPLLSDSVDARRTERTDGNEEEEEEQGKEKGQQCGQQQTPLTECCGP